MTELVSRTLVATGALERSVAAERQSTLARVIPSAPVWVDDTAPTPVSLVRTGLLLEGQALRAEDGGHLYDAAFSCWRDLHTRDAASQMALFDGCLAPDLNLAFHLAVTGTLARRVTEVRQALIGALPVADDLEVAELPDSPPWDMAVLRDTALAVILLTRKADGWSDVDLALRLLRSLRERQGLYEDAYFETAPDAEVAAVRLAALYHLAQMGTLAGEYITTGRGASSGLAVRLDTHHSQARRAIELLHDGDLSRFVDLLHAVLRSLVEHSLWSQVETLGTKARAFAKVLAEAPEPTLELWPSQEEAMEGNFLDAYRRAVVVEMPTSAGKTLLAKFAIVQTLALNPDATIAYVVPTRVLVNQVTDDLRRDLSLLDFTVEQAVPVFDLDPTEDALLQVPPNVLVTTPEKLDLLIRSNHVSLTELSMVVVDEAHNLADTSRGARLELVLATIRRDRPNARYLLLSPFIPNADELVRWLGDGRGLDPIRVAWRPNRRIVGALEVAKRRDPSDRRRLIRDLQLVTVNAVDNSSLLPGTAIDLGLVNGPADTLQSVSLAAARKLGARGQTLIVCAGRSTAVKRALQVADERSDVVLSEFAQAVIRHTITELGPDNTLARALKRGVAYHHAGVSLETRRLLEELLLRREIAVICGTTTLAQGANFPLANVIVEGLRKGRADQISYSEFWNIAGRAGRGMMQEFGVVAFPALSAEQRFRWTSFFAGEAEEVASQLADLVTRADTIGVRFTRDVIRDHPNLSSFLQYLAHAFNVSGSLTEASQVEDLLRSSLVFQQVESRSEEQAQALVRLCRSYLDSIQGNSALVSLADGTGFSTPTIRGVLQDIRDYPQIRDVSTWDPHVLFGDDISGLRDRVELVGGFPEMQLGESGFGYFNARRIAEILRDWVNGVPINVMADRYSADEADPIAKQAKFSNYLQSRLAGLASWGVGALERVALAGQSDEPAKLGDAGHVPSMLLFGVNEPEAVWLRMAGLNRDAARGAGNLWRRQGLSTPNSFAELRDWISSVSDAQWDAALQGTAYQTGDMRLLWGALH